MARAPSAWCRWPPWKPPPERTRDLYALLKAEMKTCKLELSVTKDGKEGKSKVEVFNPSQLGTCLSVDGTRIDCRATAPSDVLKQLIGTAKLRWWKKKQVGEMDKGVWFEPIRAFTRRRCKNKCTPRHAAHARTWDINVAITQNSSHGFLDGPSKTKVRSKIAQVVKSTGRMSGKPGAM